MKRLYDHPVKKVSWLLLIVFIIIVPFLTTRCGTQASTGGSASVSAVTVKGQATATSALSASVLASSSLSGADVTISIPIASGLTTLATGTADSSGNYSLELSSAIVSSNASDGRVNNLVVTVSKDATVVSTIIPTFSTATSSAFAPIASPENRKKQILVQKLVQKGMDRNDIDYNSDIDRPFSTIDGDETKIDKMADAMYNSETNSSKIATGLGISSTILAQLEKKAREYHDTYVEPLFRSAFESNTQPSQDALDKAFANMGTAMKDYAISLGLSPDQFVDLKNMRNKDRQSKMETQLGQNDTMMIQQKRRDEGNKMLDLFNAQYDAADILANASTSSKQNFAQASPTTYAAFQNAKATITNALATKLNDPTITNPMVIGDYLRTNFFDAYLFPTPQNMPTENSKTEDMESVMTNLANSRIMVYFMQFFSQQQRMTIFQGMGATLQPIFQNRFQNTSSAYYTGPDFWASNPSATEIQSRLGKFKTALDTAVDSIISSPIDTAFSSASAATRTSYKNAFKILNAPPDAF